MYCIISISDKRLSSFFLSFFLQFYPFPFTLFFFPYLFRFNFVVSERNVHILFCRHIWAELSLLFWRFQFLSGTFFPGGGGGVHMHPVHPSSVRACIIVYSVANYRPHLSSQRSWRFSHKWWGEKTAGGEERRRETPAVRRRLDGRNVST